MTYDSKKKSRTRALKGIIASAIAVSALIIIVAVLGDPSGRKNNGSTASSGSVSTTENVTVSADTKETETKKEEESTTATTQSSTEATTASKEAETQKSGMNPKNYDEAIDTEREATFDDGPSKNTGEILDILKKYDIKATFYNVGVDSDELLELQRRVYDEGHTLAIHTLTHKYDKIYASFENWKADVLGEQERIKNNVGITTKYYRFPGGGSNSKGAKYGTSISQCIEWLDENGFSYQDWNIDSRDADGKVYTPDQMAQNVIDSVRKSEKTDLIVLMHDAEPKTTTVKCLPKVIETLKADGYTFCQITDNTKPIHHNLYQG